MSRVLALLWRCAVILAGYALACLSASAFLSLVVLGAPDPGTETGQIEGAWSVVAVPILAVVIANLAFLPAAVFVAAAELLSWRGWLTHALAGGAIGISVVSFVRNAPASATGDGALAAIAAAGMVGGITYWLIAGRRAGRMRAPDRPFSPGP